MIILGLDIGSTGCKCVAFTDSGTELCSAYKEYTHVPGNPNLNPTTLRDNVFGVVRECTAKLTNSRSVKAIAISSFGESFVTLNRNGEPIGDIIMYYVDSAGGDFSGVTGSFGAENIMEITRTKPDTMYSLAKMLPVIDRFGGNVWKFLQIVDYIAFCICGETVTDYSLATRTLLFDLAKLDWSDEILTAAGIRRELLPTPLKGGSVAGKITGDVAKTLGLPDSVQVVICGQDQITNALGSGVLRAGDAVDGNGTVECITPLFTNIPPLAFTRKNYVTVPYLDRGYATYAFGFTGGALLKWYRSAFGAGIKGAGGAFFYDYMDSMCPSVPTDTLVVPHFQGAGGTPDMVKDAKGIIWGLTLANDAFSVYRSLMEGLSFEMLINLQTLNEFSIRPKRIFAAGGGAKSQKWLQIKADIWNCEILPVLATEAGAQGAAIMAAAALNSEPVESVANRFVKHGEVVLPNAENVGIYAEKFEKYKTLREFSLSQCKDIR